MKTKLQLLKFCLVFMLQCALGAKYLNDIEEYVAYNKCLTWDDNETTLILKCRLPRMSSYVKFCHKKSKTNVTCNVVRGTIGCYPRDKTIYTFRKRKQITLMLHESKFGKNLSGDWFCQTKDRKLKTRVNLIKGIIVDLFVKIIGTLIEKENGRNQLIVECSSCRTPYDKYTEIYINGQSNTSIWLNKTGACILGHSEPCQFNRCNCSDSGNMFEIAYDDPKIGTNIACSMHFADKYRDGKYDVIVNAIFSGTDFAVTSKQINETLKDPKIITTPRSNHSVNDFNLTAEQTTKDTKQDNMESKENMSLIFDILSLIIGFALISIIIVFIYMKIQRRCKERPKSNKTATSEKSMAQNQNTQNYPHETETLLPYADKSKYSHGDSENNDSINGYYFSKATDKNDPDQSSLDLTYDNASTQTLPETIQIDIKQQRAHHHVGEKFTVKSDVHNTSSNYTENGIKYDVIADKRKTPSIFEDLSVNENGESVSAVENKYNSFPRDIKGIDNEIGDTAIQVSQKQESNAPVECKSEYEEMKSFDDVRKPTDALPCKVCWDAKKISKKSAYYCIDCGLRICLNCNENHEGFIPTKKHKRVPVKDIPDDFTGSSLCEEHMEEISYYCDDHNIVLCRLCSDGDHVQCKKITIEKKAQNNNEIDKNELKSRFDIIGKSITDILSRLERKEDGLGSSESIDILPNDETTDQNHEVTTDLENVSKQLHSLQNVDLEVCNFLYDDGSYSHAFILMNKLSRKLKEIQKFVSARETRLQSDKLPLDISIMLDSPKSKLNHDNI